MASAQKLGRECVLSGRDGRRCCCSRRRRVARWTVNGSCPDETRPPSPPLSVSFRVSSGARRKAAVVICAGEEEKDQPDDILLFDETLATCDDRTNAEVRTRRSGKTLRICKAGPAARLVQEQRTLLVSFLVSHHHLFCHLAEAATKPVAAGLTPPPNLTFS